MHAVERRPWALRARLRPTASAVEQPRAREVPAVREHTTRARHPRSSPAPGRRSGSGPDRRGGQADPASTRAADAGGGVLPLSTCTLAQVVAGLPAPQLPAPPRRGALRLLPPCPCGGLPAASPMASRHGSPRWLLSRIVLVVDRSSRRPGDRSSLGHAHHVHVAWSGR